MDAAYAAGLSDLDALVVLGDRTRRRLYEFVVEEVEPVSRDEAAGAAQIDRSLAAYHLDKLVESGLLEASYGRPPGRAGPGAGRPAKLYRRTRREFVLRTPPRDYQLLAELLVRAVGDDPSGTVRRTLDRVAYDVGRSRGERAKQDGGDGRGELKHLLRLRGYEPVEDEQGTVRLRNCPFETVASECPEVVCALNLRLVEGLIDGLSIRRRAALEPRQGLCCVAISPGATRAVRSRSQAP
jgi:predicted ArsR family transcriptional regulator